MAEGCRNPLQHSSGVAPCGAYHVDILLFAPLFVDVVEAYGCGGYEGHTGAFQKGLVAASAGAYNECVGIGHHLGRKLACVELYHLGVGA